MQPSLTEVNQGSFELVNSYMRSFITDAEAQYTDANRTSVSLVSESNRTKYGFGGLPTTDGHHIKYGKVFRGTNIDGITADEQAIMTGYLNIGLDVDLRGASSEKTRNIARQKITSIAYDSQKYSGASDLLVGSKVKNEAFAKDYPTLENYTGSTLKEKAENLLVSYGLDIDDIHAFQNAMIE